MESDTDFETERSFVLLSVDDGDPLLIVAVMSLVYDMRETLYVDVGVWLYDTLVVKEGEGVVDMVREP